ELLRDHVGHGCVPLAPRCAGRRRGHDLAIDPGRCVLVELRRGDHRRQRRGSGLEREQQHYDGRQRGRERGTVDAKAGHSADAKYLLQMAEGSARILLVDDEESVQTLLAYPLRKDGFEVVAAGNGREALDRFAEQRFDLVVLDIMLPGVDGIEVCRRMRSRSQVPIIMLTAKDDEIDKVIDFERRTVSMRTEQPRLTYVEFEILAALARSPGRVQTREMLLEQVWGDSAYRDPRTIDVH